MKTLKKLISTALLASLILGTGCSHNPGMPSKQSAVNYTENTELTDAEIKEIKELQVQLQDKIDAETSEHEALSFNVKTAEAGEDVNIDMLLFHPKAAKRARFWGIKNANKLVNAGSSPTKRWFLYRKLGGLFPSASFKSQVLFWVERADLLRIPSVSLDDSFLLVMAGLTSVPHLAMYNNPIDQGALQVQTSLLAFQYGLPVPSGSDVSKWTQQATVTPPMIY